MTAGDAAPADPLRAANNPGAKADFTEPLQRWRFFRKIPSIGQQPWSGVCLLERNATAPPKP